MDKSFYGFVAAGFVVCLLCAIWGAVGAWSGRSLTWRAEVLGDHGAMEELAKRALKADDAAEAAYWMHAQGEMSEHDALFFLPREREAARLMFEAMGRPTPLLDVLVE